MQCSDIINLLYAYIYNAYIHTHTLYACINAGEEIYFFGIINFLHGYTADKKAKTMLRSMFYNKRNSTYVS